MNTFKKIAMVAMSLVLSTAMTFAAPSKENNGSTYTLTDPQSDTFISKYEDATVALNFDQWKGVPADVLAKINDFNDGKISLADLVDGEDVTGYAALSSCDDVVMYNTDGEQVAGTNVKVTIKNAAINSTVKNATVKVGHYNIADQKWEFLAAEVDTDANTAEVTMPSFSPVVLIYTATATNNNTVPNTGLYANPTYLAIGAACAVAAIALIAKKKRA